MAKQIYQSFDFNGNVINGVAAGVSATDVANKGQVDAAIVTAQAYTDVNSLTLTSNTAVTITGMVSI